MLSHWNQGELDIHGIHIHYTRTGAGKEGIPPLVLLHGFSDNGLCWLPLAQELEAEWDIILPDARGHGLSERVKPGEHLDMAADVAELIQALALKRPVVGGHSMGANIAAQVEARFPGLARALILEDPPWREAQPPPQGEQETKGPPLNPYVQWLMSLPGKTVDEVMAKCQEDNPTWAEIELRPWAESKLQFDTAFMHTQGAWPDWQEIVRAIHCPTLLITAEPEKGAIVTPQTARRATELAPSIQVIQIPGAGHNIRRENYAVYLSAVRKFLGSLLA